MGKHRIEPDDDGRTVFNIGTPVDRQATIAALIRKHREQSPGCTNIIGCVLDLIIGDFVGELLGSRDDRYPEQARKRAVAMGQAVMDIASYNVTLAQLVGDAAAAYQAITKGQYPGEEIHLAMGS